jgi:hypothetical protein
MGNGGGIYNAGPCCSQMTASRESCWPNASIPRDETNADLGIRAGRGHLLQPPRDFCGQHHRREPVNLLLAQPYSSRGTDEG